MKSRVTGGKDDPECRTVSVGVVEAFDAASVGLDDGPAEAQTDAEAPGLGGEEGRVKVVHDRRGDPGA